MNWITDASCDRQNSVSSVASEGKFSSGFYLWMFLWRSVIFSRMGDAIEHLCAIRSTKKAFDTRIPSQVLLILVKMKNYSKGNRHSDSWSFFILIGACASCFPRASEVRKPRVRLTYHGRKFAEHAQTAFAQTLDCA